MAKLRVDKITAPIVKDEFTGSVYFDGTGDYLSLSSNTDFAMGTGDFTAECFINATSFSNAEGSYSERVFDSNTGQLGIYVTSDGSGTIGALVSGTDHRGNNSPTLSGWTHVALTRSGSTVRIFLNGVLDSSFTNSGSVASSGDFLIGARASGQGGFLGYISNFRICKGHAVYTGNFTVPTRELPVHKAPPKGVVFPAADNRTVLLACQSSTDATLDSSGRHTITATGNATAADANPGLFRRTLNLTTVTENTGSVYFDGTGDYLKTASSSDFAYGTGDFTWEMWVYVESFSNNRYVLDHGSNGGTISNGGSGNTKFLYYNTTVGTGGELYTTGFGTNLSTNTWYHLAAVRKNGTTFLYTNGVLTASQSDTHNYGAQSLNIGAYSNGANPFTGYISNLRICKGHAVYKSQFIPPTRELEVHEGPDDDRTVLLACYDGENIFADKSGRHIIAAYGDRLSSPTPTATDSPIGITTFQPGLTRSVDPTAGPTFQGGVGFVSQNWLTLPKGTTTERFVEVANNAVSASSARGINGGGYIAPNNTNTMQYITIATTGNGADFGDLSAIRNTPGAVASSTRGIWMGGTGPSPSNTSLDTIDYVTISTLGDAADFGNLINNHRADSAAGNSTRGLRLGQQQSPAVGNTIEYITIASTGDAKDFGDLVQGRSQSGAFASPTRAVNVGGYGGPSTGNVNTIDYVTIQTMGNSIDFGDLKSGASTGVRGCSNATRGIFGGGFDPTPFPTGIDYLSIASTGNSQDFGNLTKGSRYGSSCSSLTRGIFFIGEGTSPTPGQRQEIDYVELATLANANDFGDLINSYSGYIAAACSNGHGGLG